ncbi:MAG: phosphodiester glycosidase family protein [Patescibacteria group bacterium]
MKKELKNGISNIPVLLLEGKNVLSESESEIDAKMRASSAKSFICSNEKGDVVHFGTVTSATIYEMPEFLRKNFGCYQAIGLDNGGSMGMSYEGRTVRKPGRKIMDAFAVVEVPDSVRTERALVEKKVSAYNVAFAKQIRQMKRSGKSVTEISVWIAATRTKVSKLAEAAKKKNPESADAKVWLKVLESPALKK